MAIAKDQILSPGEFYPSSEKNVIYRCRVNNTTGFLRDITIFSVLIGFFTFFIMQWFALIVVPLSWPLLMAYMLPRHYRFIQLNKYSVVYGSGSILTLIYSKFNTIFKLRKGTFKEIHYLRLNRWEKTKRGGLKDTFGRIEIKVNQNEPIFHILINSTDLGQLVNIFDTYRFQTKVQKIRSRGELMIIFPQSPRYNLSN